MINILQSDIGTRNETTASTVPEKIEISSLCLQHRPTIIHVYNSLELGGGAEKLAHILAKEHDRSKINIMYLCLGEKGFWGEKIEQLGLPVRAFKLKGAREYWKLPILLRSYINENRVDIVHTHLLEVDFFVRLFLILHQKLHFVRTVHNVYMTSETGFGKLEFHQKVFYHTNFFLDHLSSGILFISKAVKDSFPKFRLKKDSKFHVLYNTFNEDDLKPTESPVEIKRVVGIEHNTFPVVCTIGRLAEQKGHSLLLLTLQKLKIDFPRFKFIVIGDGPLRKGLEKQCRELEIHDNVIFMGKQEHIANFLQITDIYIQPSLWEGFGITLLEAMAMGLPVIASDTGGMAEIVEDGINGLLFRNKDTQDLYQKIILLLRDRELRENISREANKDAFKRFSGRKYGQNLTEIYMSLLN
jgi:glycosyltransferase involved in cell wall biosynthesis